MKFLELKIHPPIIFLLCIGMIWSISNVTSGIQISDKVRYLSFGFVVILAMILAVLAVLSFRKMQTTIHPHHPEQTSLLVTSGVFKLTRNPMYLALALLLLAASIFVAIPWALVAVGGFIAYITQFQIKPEERILKDKFAQEYSQYMLRTRRWI